MAVNNPPPVLRAVDLGTRDTECVIVWQGDKILKIFEGKQARMEAQDFAEQIKMRDRLT